MSELQERAAEPGFPPVLLVHPARPDQADRFLSSRWPEARAVSDPGKKLFRAFGLGRGSVGQLFGPATILAGVRALKYGVGTPTGDPLVMSGWFLVADDAIAWEHVHEHAGAPRQFEAAAAALAAL